MAINPSNIYKTVIKRPVGEENKIYLNIGIQFFDTDLGENIEVDADITAELYDEDSNLLDTFTTVVAPELEFIDATKIYQYLNYDVTNYSGQNLTLNINYSVSSIPQVEHIVTYELGDTPSSVFLHGENKVKHDNILYIGLNKTVLLHLTNEEGRRVDPLDNSVQFILYDTESDTILLTENSTRQSTGLYETTFTVPTSLGIATTNRYQGYFNAKTSSGYEEISNSREFLTVLSQPTFKAENHGPSLCTPSDVRKVFPQIDSLIAEWRNLDIEQKEIYLQNKISLTSRFVTLEITNYIQFDKDLLADYVAYKVCQDIINFSGSRMKTDDTFLKMLNLEILRIENIFNKNDKGILRRG